MNQTTIPDDPNGLETLQKLAAAPLINKWLFDAISPYCSGKILEVGSGIGNLSFYLLKNFSNITLSDFRNKYCDILKIKYGNCANLNSVVEMDLSLYNFKEIYLYSSKKYDTIIALNVLEHIKKDALAIRNCRELLAPNGKLVLLVPAYQFLYNTLDKNLDHYKRYNKTNLSQLVNAEGLQVVEAKYFNFIGIFGWWFTGKLLKKTQIPNYQLKIFNKFIPVFRIIDMLVFNKAGLSVIVICKKID